jgi:hypothetical protein
MYTWKYFILLVLLLAGANLAAHGHALGDGLFLDDHWHELRLAESDWSIAALFDATTIVPDRLVHSWWQDQPVSWWYIRPFAVLLGKVVYHLSGGSVKALHGLSIFLHLLNGLMVHHLVLRMTRKRFWAIVAALLFVVYSHSVYAVAWLAAQNALLQTTLMLAGLLLYVRASGLDIYAGPCELEDAEAWEHGVARLRKPALFGFFVCWALALLSRESAVILPFFVVAFDWAFGGRRQVRARLGLYAVMGVVVAAFLLWRVVFFNHPMPDFYVQRPRGPEYLMWWSAKFLHALTATIWLSPMTIGPSGRFNPWVESTGDCILMLIIIAVMGVGYQVSCRRIRGYWIWPTWILLGLLPVVAILATPHNAYLPSVGFAIGMAIGPALRDKTKPTSVGRWCTGVGLWFLIATTTYMPIYRPMWYSVMAAERMTIAQVMRMPPGPQVKDIFFVNLPFVNIYARYHIDEAMGRPAKLGVLKQDDPTYRAHVLTWAPDLLRVDAPCRIEQLDGQRFRISMAGSRPWFSGALGRFLIEGLRPRGGAFSVGEVVPGELFDTVVLQVDSEGVRELEFRFHQPLTSDRFCFYVGTPGCAAARVRFAGPEAFGSLTAPLHIALPGLEAVQEAATRLERGEAGAAEVLFQGAESGEPQIRTAARAAIEKTCRPVAQALAAPVIEPRGGGQVAWADWGRVREWWRWHVDDAAVKALARCREEFAGMVWQRDALFRIRHTASTIIRTDLYLTGPPFPGPR